MKHYEKWSLIVTAIGVIVAIGVLVIYSFQLSAMRGQLAEMKSGSADTHTLAEQAKVQAAAAASAAAAAKDQAGIGKRALDAAIAQSRLDQRPWIMASQKNGTIVNVNAAPSSWVSIINTGKTPAFRINGHFYVEIVPNGEKPHFDSHFVHFKVTAGVMFPNVPLEVNPIKRQKLRKGSNPEEGEDDPITEKERSALNDGTDWIAVHGRVEYYDTFHLKHWTNFCFWSFIKSGYYESKYCTDYNNTDD